MDWYTKQFIERAIRRDTIAVEDLIRMLDQDKVRLYLSVGESTMALLRKGRCADAYFLLGTKPIQDIECSPFIDYSRILTLWACGKHETAKSLLIQSLTANPDAEYLRGIQTMIDEGIDLVHLCT